MGEDTPNTAPADDILAGIKSAVSTLVESIEALDEKLATQEAGGEVAEAEEEETETPVAEEEEEEKPAE